MEEINKTNNEENNQSAADSNKKIKTREGSGYLRQLYSTARNTAGSTHSNFKNLTTFLVNFVPVDKVDASELQVRTHFDDEEIAALSKSIKEHGVLQPILVVQNGDRYKVIAGERRLRASKMAGMDRIPARVITSDDKSVHEIALRENLDRVDLHPIEEGEGYVSLIEAGAYSSHDNIASAFGKPKSRITECIGYTKLPRETKDLIMKHSLKQRSILRKLMNTPPESHVQVVEEFLKAGEDQADLLFSEKDKAWSEVNKEKNAAIQKQIKQFEYLINEKQVAVPAFRWKVGEGNERLKDYVTKLYKLISDLESNYKL